MATIRDVAAEAGLSVSVVSKYLNNPESVLPETRVRLNAAISNLNYRPNRFAQGLRTGNTGFILLLVPELNNPMFSSFFTAASQYCAKQGYIPILQLLDYDQSQELHLMEADGIISFFVNHDDLVGKIYSRANRQFPVATIGFRTHANASVTVLIDLNESMRKITRHMIANGYTNIAYIGESNFEHDSLAKYAGFVTEMGNAKLSVNPDLVLSDYSDFSGGYHAAQTILSAGRPDAIVAETDLLAIGCAKYLLHNKIRIPSDIAVAGFDDIPLSEIYEPSITTARIPVDAAAERGVSMLFEQIRDPNYTGTWRTCCDIVIREST